MRKEYTPGVFKGIDSVLCAGIVAGYPVLDMKATLVDGAYRDVDSSVMAFELAGRAATREGLRRDKPRLMEPFMQVDITTPEEYMGDVLGDINGRRRQVGDLGEQGSVKDRTTSRPTSGWSSRPSSRARPRTTSKQRHGPCVQYYSLLREEY